MDKFVLKLIESIMGKGKKASNELFSLSYNYLKILISMGCLYSGLSNKGQGQGPCSPGGPRLGQYSFPGLMIVIVTGFIPLSPLSVVSTMVMVMWESSQWFGKNIVGTG